jgi:hypothetical protein
MRSIGDQKKDGKAARIRAERLRENGVNSDSMNQNAVIDFPSKDYTTVIDGAMQQWPHPLR